MSAAPANDIMNAAVQDLLATLGPDLVRTGNAIPERNWADQVGLPPQRPIALVLPRTTEDVSKALRDLPPAQEPVVTQGGMTGLAGGAHPGEGEVALSLERMVGIEEVDTASNTLTALSGTPLLPDPAGGRGGRADVRHRSGRARLLLHRRQRRHQCRRQPGAALRHGAQERARA